MKTSIYLIIFFFSTFNFAQTIEELEGEWLLESVTFSGEAAAEMSEEDKKVPCLDQAYFIFEKDKITSNMFYGDDCSQPESETVKYRLNSDKNIEVWEEYEQKWDLAEVKNYATSSFLLVYKEMDEDFTMTLSFKKKE